MTSQSPPPPSSVVSGTSNLSTTSAGGATLLIGLQVGSRALTFIVNQLLLRYLSPEIFGISTQLEVYSITVLFFARESLRVAIQRQSDDPTDDPKDGNENVPEGHVDGRTAAGKTQGIVNLAYISIYLGCIFAFMFAWLYLKNIGAAVTQEVQYLSEALKVYALAAIWELLAEPCFVVVQQKSMYGIRARAEAVATLLRCLVTCGSAVWASRSNHGLGVLPFALGQAAYALVLSGVYYLNLWNLSSDGGFSLVMQPVFLSDASAYILGYFSRPLLILGASIFVQSIVKHILTQGDTFLIAALSSPAVQGTYALANNYGGLLARLILQPIEESSRNYFGKLLSTVNGKPPKDLVLQARKNLFTLLRSYVLLSVCVVAVGPTVAPLLLKIVAGSRWAKSGAGEVLATYCYYIPLLAVNGITEAFVSSVATESEVNRQSAWMLAFSAGFGGAAFVFLGILELGAQGLVWANVINMAFRIVWSIMFIRRFLRRNGSNFDFAELLPRATTVAAGVGTYGILNRLALTFNGGIMDLVKSSLVAGVFVVILAIDERAYLFNLYKSMRGNIKQE